MLNILNKLPRQDEPEKVPQLEAVWVKDEIMFSLTKASRQNGWKVAKIAHVIILARNSWMEIGHEISEEAMDKFITTISITCGNYDHNSGVVATINPSSHYHNFTVQFFILVNGGDLITATLQTFNDAILSVYRSAYEGDDTPAEVAH